MHDAERISRTARIAELQRAVDACVALEKNPGDHTCLVQLGDFSRLIRDTLNRRLIELTYGDDRRA